MRATLPTGVECVGQFNEEGNQWERPSFRKRKRFSHELTLAYETVQIVEIKEVKETEEGKPCDEACSYERFSKLVYLRHPGNTVISWTPLWDKNVAAHAWSRWLAVLNR